MSSRFYSRLGAKEPPEAADPGQLLPADSSHLELDAGCSPLPDRLQNGSKHLMRASGDLRDQLRHGDSALLSLGDGRVGTSARGAVRQSCWIAFI